MWLPLFEGLPNGSWSSVHVLSVRGEQYVDRPVLPAKAWEAACDLAILLSFESNLFIYLMMVASESPRAAGILAITLVFNVFLALWLLGLAGSCMVIVLTKLLMTFSSSYPDREQSALRAYLIIIWVVSGLLVVKPWVTLHPAVLVQRSCPSIDLVCTLQHTWVICRGGHGPWRSEIHLKARLSLAKIMQLHLQT